MRLVQFIETETAAILTAWDAFARTVLPAARMDDLALRDHAADILLAIVRDMRSADAAANRSERAGGYDGGGPLSLRLNGTSEEHAIERLGSGFNLLQLISEYRALRASVLDLWRKSLPRADNQDVDDVTLFHKSIDRSLASAAASYTRRVDESRDMFLAILSHDLRNPLNAITMSAQLLPLEGKLDAASARVASRITGSARVMSKMIADLLDYTRTRLGAGMPVAPAPMDLAVTCREVIEEFQTANPAVLLLLDSDGDTAGTWDPARLRQVVSNLLANAIQHGDTRPPIRLSLAGAGDGVTLSIRNAGTPIPSGDLTRIFDPLVRSAASATPKQYRPGSIGLGLYIARELVVAHGGTIGVTSSVEAGTAFAFRLPRHPPGHVVADARPGATLSEA